MVIIKNFEVTVNCIHMTCLNLEIMPNANSFYILYYFMALTLGVMGFLWSMD